MVVCKCVRGPHPTYAQFPVPTGNGQQPRLLEGDEYVPCTPPPQKSWTLSLQGLGPSILATASFNRPQNQGKTKGRADQPLLVRHCLCWAALG